MMNTTCIVFLVNQLSIRFAIDENGTKVFDASYDAWGKQTVTLNTIGLMRGYTGHEMLNEFNLINMNGRIYGPELGRFFSPDNYVQAPDNSQSYNRYSYCLNNPLKFVDHSGNIFGIDDIIWGFALGAIMGYANACFKHDNVFWGIILGGAVGGIIGNFGGSWFGSFCINYLYGK